MGRGFSHQTPLWQENNKNAWGSWRAEEDLLVCMSSEKVRCRLRG